LAVVDMKATRVVEEVAKQIAEAILGDEFVGKAGRRVLKTCET